MNFSIMIMSTGLTTNVQLCSMDLRASSIQRIQRTYVLQYRGLKNICSSLLSIEEHLFFNCDYWRTCCSSLLWLEKQMFFNTVCVGEYIFFNILDWRTNALQYCGLIRLIILLQYCGLRNKCSLICDTLDWRTYVPHYCRLKIKCSIILWIDEHMFSNTAD